MSKHGFFMREEEVQMWNFLLKEIEDPVTGTIERDRIRARGLNIWEKYKAESGSDRSVTSLRKRYSLPNFPTPMELNIKLLDKIKLYFALALPVDERFLPLIHEVGEFELDEFGKLLWFKENKADRLHLHLAPYKRIRSLQPNSENIKRRRVETDSMAADENEFGDDEVYGEYVDPEVDDYQYEAPPNETLWMMRADPVKTESNHFADLVASSVSAKNSKDPTSQITPLTPPVSEAQSVESVVQKEAPIDAMQQFLATLTDTIVKSNTTMLSAVKELVPSKIDTSGQPKKKKKKKRSLMAIPNSNTPGGSMKCYLEGMKTFLLSIDSSGREELKDVLNRVNEEIGNVSEEGADREIPVQKIRTMMEASLAMMGL